MNSSKMTRGHRLAATALAILITSVYGTITWGLVLNNPDFVTHIQIAQRLYDTARPPVPHFLFHALTVALFWCGVAPSLFFAGRLVMLACYAFTALVLYFLFWKIFKDSPLRHPLILFLAALATLLAEPITLAHAYALGFFWPEPYQVPTSIMLKPFALLGFAFCAWFLDRHLKAEWRTCGLFALCTLAGALSKPSFIICLLPASFVLLTYHSVTGRESSLPGLIAGLYLPAAAVLLWQYYETYSGAAGAASAHYRDSIVWAPLKFMSFWASGLVWKFLLSILFPLAVTVIYCNRVRRDTMLQLAWICFLVGAFYSYTLAEKVHWRAGNMVWSGYISLFTLLFAAMVFWLRQIAFEPLRGRWFWPKALLCGGIIALHAFSGARLDWLYLAHYGCRLDFRHAEFVCAN